MASPSGSEAATVKVICIPSIPDTPAGAVTTGGSGPLIVIWVVADPVSPPAEAVNVTLYVPACVELGVQMNVPDELSADAVNVAPEGRTAAVSEVTGSPHGVSAVTVKER